MNIRFESAAMREGYGLCVVGAGPAGIMLALEHARRAPERRVLLLDCGPCAAGEPNTLDASIQVDNLVNHHPPHECTNKGLGGSSETWGGRCVMYDRGDFLPRPIIGNHCTWSVSFFDDCLPFVDAAQVYFESGSGPFDLSGDLRHAPIAENFRSSFVTDTVLERWSLPTRFGPHYSKELAAQSNLDVLLGVEARELPAPDANGAVSWLGVREVSSGRMAKIRAEILVLAAGTQETTRLLLRNSAIFSRLPSPPSALGKFYQGHVSGKIASVRFRGDPKLTEYGFRREADGAYQRRRFQFTQSTLVKENLLNTAFWLDNPLYFDPSHRSGAMSFMYLAMLTPGLGKRLAPPAVAHSITKGKVHRVGAHLRNILLGLPGSFWSPASIFFRRYLKRRKLPGVFLYSKENKYALHFHAEQIPSEENRMELGPDGETLVIRYRVTEADAEGVIRAHEILDRELEACGAGRLEYWFPREQLRDAIISMSRDGVHQSGTTRIADNPAEGVVDANLRVWGTENLYICSSSVFPTSGQANPTFFTGVCALRLAHHLIHRHAHS
jgi:hypothetical protein